MKKGGWLLFSILAACATVFCNLASVTPSPGPLTATDTPALATDTEAAPTPSPGPASGSISGHLSYPSEVIPELRVVAFDAADTTKYYFVDTVQNQSTYLIENLPAGTYHVVAYVLDPTYDVSGGYSQAVPCGLLASCSDHTLLPVVVQPGQTTGNVDPGDWYAPKGAFPAGPLP